MDQVDAYSPSFTEIFSPAITWNPKDGGPQIVQYPAGEVLARHAMR
jgi:hypothetical protein